MIASIADVVVARRRWMLVSVVGRDSSDGSRRDRAATVGLTGASVLVCPLLRVMTVAGDSRGNSREMRI